MSIIASLEKLGLSEQEAAIFVFLAQSGPAKAPQIQAALAINKLAAYRALKRLTDGGFVITYGDKRLQKYAAVPLQKVVSEYDKNVHDIRQAQSEFEDWSKNLAQKEEQLYKDRKIQVYEGVEGLRLWYTERLNGDVPLIREFGNNLFWYKLPDSAEMGNIMTLDARHKRLDKKIPLQSIFVTDSSTDVVDDHARTRADYMKETKVINIPGLPTGNISVFGTRFGFYTLENGVMRGVIVEDSTLAGLVNAIFEMLWQQAQLV